MPPQPPVVLVPPPVPPGAHYRYLDPRCDMNDALKHHKIPVVPRFREKTFFGGAYPYAEIAERQRRQMTCQIVGDDEDDEDDEEMQRAKMASAGLIKKEVSLTDQM